MMWWGDGVWGPGILAAVLFMFLCMVLMGRMMGHGMHGSHAGGSHGHRPDGPERILANRLASGEIDLEEYKRRLAVLRATKELDRSSEDVRGVG